MVWKNVVLIFILCATTIFCSNLDIYFIDVGEGESVLFKTPQNKIVVIDSGNIITGFTIVKFLKKLKINKIDNLIITHPHPDHSGGVFHILQQLKVLQKYDNGQPLDVNECKDFYRWYKQIYRNGNYTILKKGSKIFLDNVEFKVLSPENLSNNWNDNSLVIIVSYKKIKVLLMADASKLIEKKLLDENINLKADILKIGHHGAYNATSKNFIKEVSPKYAIISINKNNFRGYPSEKTLEILKQNNIKVYTTYKYGTIHFRTNGKNLEILGKEYYEKQ